MIDEVHSWFAKALHGLMRMAHRLGIGVEEIGKELDDAYGNLKTELMDEGGGEPSKE